jgi:hypothetical protein
MSSTKARPTGLLRRAAVLCTFTFATTAWAGGPRFVSGSIGYTKAGVPMAWYTGQPLYFTDPGDLSPTVTHAQADAMVAAAAGDWNVPTANLTLAQGGALAEHVDTTDTYFNGTDIVFPADVRPSNYLNIQIAVVYDTDGSITDLLLGNGASDPSGCLQNGVLESVDAFGPTAVIEHAVIVLNGRCTGSDPRQLTQMQYQLTRVFGRVLGLAWSQLNDSIFTGVSPVTATEEAFWPLMHPIDVRCGTYTYQCMQNAFTLRPDDLSALAQLYPVTSANAMPGKTLSSFNAISVSGPLNFPTGQGMELVNVTVRRRVSTMDRALELYPIVSSTTGYSFMENSGGAIVGAEAASENAGINQAGMEGDWSLTRIPAGTHSDYLMFQTESINTLYYDEYAVGAYQRPVIAMSGSPLSFLKEGVTQGVTFKLTLTQADAAASCSAGSDGTASNPVAADPSGWWTGLLCSTGHTSWVTQPVKANHSWTIEATAVDETGAPTPQKAQLVVGVWNTADPTGTLPTVAAQPVAMNSVSLGMTQIQMPSVAADSTLRIAVADQYGAGRPDFAYNARVLYADSLSPATLGAGGGQITITGIGFRKGNQVTVNGVAATVIGWTATQIVATAPGKGAAQADTAPVDVAVLDPSTAGSTIMQAALTYTGTAIDNIVLISAPSSLETGTTASTPFAVRVYQSDGVTPAAGAVVNFVVTGSGGSGAVLMNCGGSVGCSTTTDATGLAQQHIMGVAVGSVTISGTEASGGASVQATILDADPVRTVTLNAAPQYLAAGASGSWSISLQATQDGSPAAGVSVIWSTAAAGFTLTPAAATTTTNGTSTVLAQVNAITGASTNVVGGCVWTSVCATWTVYGIAPPQWTIATANGVGQSVASGASLTPVTFLVTDGANHPLPGAAVNLYQTSYAWEGSCPTLGPCASAPVLATSETSAVSDANGLVQLTPLQVPTVAQVVKIAASTGTQGFATASLQVTP